MIIRAATFPLLAQMCLSDRFEHRDETGHLSLNPALSTHISFLTVAALLKLNFNMSVMGFEVGFNMCFIRRIVVMI